VDDDEIVNLARHPKRLETAVLVHHVQCEFLHILME